VRGRSVFFALALSSVVVAACGWDPHRPFDREAPEVNQAIASLEAGALDAAAGSLENYLSTGECKEGSIGLPSPVRARPNGGFDLGLAIFKIGEAYGQRFGDEEESDAGDSDAKQRRGAEIACALALVQHVATGEDTPIDLKARARYLEGNLDFLGTDYEAAVAAYDQAIALAPGMVDAGDPVGRDAAWNRAIALRRIEDKKDAGQDANQDSPNNPDSSQNPPDSSQPPDASQPDSSNQDSGGQDSSSNQDSSKPNEPDAGSDSGQDSGPPPPEPDAGPPPPPRSSQDESILDRLENAPTVQQEDAKRHAGKRIRGMEDK
jgi:hypothetical protein